MPKPTDAGPAASVAERLTQIHTRNETLEHVLNSGIGDAVQEQLPRQIGYFSGYTEAYGYEPWSWDGTTLTLLGDVNAGPGDQHPYGFSTIFESPGNSSPFVFVELNGKVYFSAYTEEYGYELHRFDPVTGTTGLVANIDDSAASSYPGGSGFIVFNDDLYFTARSEEGGFQLYTMDGDTEAVTLVPAPNGGPDGLSPHSFTIFDGDLYFGASTETGGALCKVDGTSGAVTLVADLNDYPYDSGAGRLTVFNGDLYFLATAIDDVEGWGVFKIEGMSGQVELVQPLDVMTVQTFYPGFYEFDGDLYFTGSSAETGQEMWKIDGVTGAVGEVFDLNSGPEDSRPYQYLELNGDLYFSAFTEETGTELFKLDGQSGTVGLAADIYQGEESSYPERLVAFDGDLYFTATAEGTGRELYRLDGQTGALDAFDFASGPTGSNAYVIGVVNGTLAVAPSYDTDGDGWNDQWVMYSATSAPESVADFSIVTDGSGTFQPASFIIGADGDLLV